MSLKIMKKTKTPKRILERKNQKIKKLTLKLNGKVNLGSINGNVAVMKRRPYLHEPAKLH